MSRLFEDMSDFTKIFQDDICIHSMDEETHRSHVELVLRRLIEAKIIPNFDKYVWNVDEVSYCGYLVGKGLTRVDSNRVNIFKSILRPKTVEKHIKTEDNYLECKL
eukprot:TRINITY_DN581_c0_g1_i13.p1 TRINITY_DN581_c0_g1~~TRINITY_DN581_c0_g1_i13.p1  ORF type:complete len:106 (+),score=10.33 TRINITY_DN581_c0_g1_i13:157-474(+)